MKLLLTILLLATGMLNAQRQETERVGTPWEGPPGVNVAIEEIMKNERASPPVPFAIHPKKREFEFDRHALPQNPLAPAVASWPVSGKESQAAEGLAAASPQTVGTSFMGTQISEGPGYIPPDIVGDVGPTQILIHVNGRIKVFDKAGNVGGLNASDLTFWNSVRYGQEVSDPHVRYDPTSGRWFLCIINVPASGANRILIAMSSGPIISSGASFTFFGFQQDSVGASGSDAGAFADYPTLGVDANALYIGANMFKSSSGRFIGSSVFVVRKSALLSNALTVTPFREVCTAASAGPYSPQGVQNDDPASAEGYFIGVDALIYSKLDILRITNPGGTPSISGNLPLTVPTTTGPINQVAKGSTASLDAVDDRLFAAQLKRNKLTGLTSLWTAHNIQVDASGVGNTSGGRNGSRWYEITGLTSTPVLRQSGTVFSSASSNPVGYWIPSVAMSGQGHMALGSSYASANDYASIAAAGRLSGDALGTTQTVTQALIASSAYNVQSSSPQRWGDFTQTVVDPADDMTLWTFQEYCNATNSWALRVIQLLAPPPATPASASPSSVSTSTSNVSIVVTGTSVAGSAFFDPGPGFTNRLSAAVGGGGVTVNSATFTDPLHVTLNVSVAAGAAAGARLVTITNPDGQSAASLSGILTVTNSTCPTITLAPSTLPDGAVGVFYSQSVSASGGAIPYSYAVSSGTLPAGLFLSPGGAVSGTPSGNGTSNVTITATDDSGCTGDRSYSITITGCPAITLSPASLPDGTVGSVYGQTVTASGGISPYLFAVSAGTLPPGLSLSTAGVISGTPADSGTSTFTITATDSDSCTGQRAYMLAMHLPPPPASIVLSALGVGYSQNFDSLVNSGQSSFLPTGWLMSESGSNADSTYTAGDGSSNTGDTYSFGSAGSGERALGGLQSGSLNPTFGARFVNHTGFPILSLVISYTGEQWRLGGTGRADRIDFQLSTDATTLASGTFTDENSLDFSSPTTTGSTGALDGNASNNRGTVSSTISGLDVANDSSFVIRWRDLNVSGADDGLAVDNFTLTPLGAGPETHPTGSGQAAPAAVTGGDSTLLTVAVTPGENPLSTGITVSGDLSSIGGSASQQFVDDGTDGDVTKNDSIYSHRAVIPQNTPPGVKHLAITIADFQGRSDTTSISLTVLCPTVSLSPDSLPSDTVGVFYSQVITASGGTPPYTFSVSSGPLPDGLQLSALGTLSGTPTTAESVSVTIAASDAYGCSGSRLYTIRTIQGENTVVTLDVSPNWNLVSNPVRTANDSVASLFPSSTSNAFAYVPGIGYQVVTLLGEGNGAWLKFGAAEHLTIIGAPILSDTIDVVDGWNLVGSISKNVAVSDIGTIGTTLNTVFGFNGSYQLTDSIISGKAFWLNVSGSGQCILSSPGRSISPRSAASVLGALDRLIVSDAVGNQQTLYFGTAPAGRALSLYLLPPTPPAGIFDVRFGSQRYAEFADDIRVREIPITLSSAAYPVNFHWFPSSAQARGELLVNGSSTPLAGEGELRVADKEPRLALRLLPAGLNKPKEFALFQNSPNPFNPVTEIKYRIASVSRVTLSIVDLLGREVETLVDQTQEPGEYTVVWQAERVPSGVYYYRLNAGGYTDVKKMLLLK